MSVRKPVYLLSGGRPGRGQSYESVISEILHASGNDFPYIAYTGTANGDDAGFFTRMAGMFGISSSRIVHAVMSHPHADIEKAKDILESADIVFVSGGDVNAGMDILREKNMLDFLDNLYDSGKLFFGTSAGAIMLAKEWVRWPDPEDASSAELFPCLGFAPVICDCHDEESGWEELKAALELKKNGTKGYGLAAGSSVKVSPAGDIKVLSGAVHPHIRTGNGIDRLPDMLT